ncbi:Uncharacterized protein YsdA, partial [Folsomia candida]
SPPRKIDPLGLFLNFNVALFSIYGYFLSPFLYYVDLDPGYLFTRYVLHLEVTTLSYRLFTHSLRFLQVLVIFQVSRHLPILISSLSLFITILLDAIYKLELRAVLIRSTADLQIRKHRELALILQLVGGVVAPATAIMMGLGLLMSVVYNFVTIRLYSVIPMPLYLYFPSVSVLIPVIIEALLPFGIRLNEKAVQLRNKWDRELERCGDRKKATPLPPKNEQSMHPIEQFYRIHYASFLLVFGFVSFFAMRNDKSAARGRKWRTSEAYLHLLEFLGGWVGSLCAQVLFCHKIRKASYQLVYWFIVMFHVVFMTKELFNCVDTVVKLFT